MAAAIVMASACSVGGADGEDDDHPGSVPIVKAPADGATCRIGESRCTPGGDVEPCQTLSDGPNPVSTSVWGEYPGWISCDSQCVQLEHPLDGYQAVCASGNRPDPRCEGTPYACDGDDVITCRYGYNVGSEPHGCGDGTYCVDGLERCALSPDPDPRCPEADPGCPAQPNDEGIWGGCQTRVCDGTRATLLCVAGYALEEEVCGTYEVCEETPVVTHCDPQLDPRCPEDDGYAFVCDGNVLLTCSNGKSEEKDCGNQTCVEDDGYARCA